MMYNLYVGKQYFFLAGLFRSGNTLLSSILNQNPNIHSSPISVVSEILWQTHLIKNSQHYKMNKDKSQLDNFAKSVMDVYYKDINKPIIIDREKGWATPPNLSLIKKYITPTPKIIYTTRPTLEVIASLIKTGRDVYLDSMHSSRYIYKNYLSENDNLAEFIMSNEGVMNNAFSAINSINDPDNAGVFYLIDYHDLVNTPEKVIDGLYDFLEIEKFNHDFNNIKTLEVYDDSSAGLYENLHKIRESLSLSDTDPQSYFSEYVINKYKNYNLSSFI